MENNSQLPNSNANKPSKDVGQSDKDTPTRIEVENMILKGKSDNLQTLIIVVLALFALLGAIFPFISSIYQGDRVDRAIDKMETSFKELVGKQLRKPKIICKKGSELLLNNVFQIVSERVTYFVGIHNDGEGVAGPIDAYIYFKGCGSLLDQEIAYHSLTWEKIPSDEPDYENKYSVGSCDHISPQDVFYIPFHIEPFRPFDCNAMLEVFYGEPTPIKVPFTLRMGEVKKQSQ
jgi:hypothetical protein